MPPSERFIQAARPPQTSDTRLFAALVTLGIEPLEMPAIYSGETPDGRPRMTWTLAHVSKCGQYHTRAMMEAWHSMDWMKNNPEHPLAYLKAFCENLNVAVDHVKDPQHQMTVIRGRGGKIGLLSPNDPRATREAFLRILKR
jgi:hypothetical protein